MKTDHNSLATVVDIDHRVRRDQAAAALRSSAMSLPSNAVAAAVTSLMLWNHVPAPFLLSWLCIILSATIGRYVALRRVRLSGAVDSCPNKVLTVSWIGALVAGLTWAVLPIVCEAILVQHASMLLFILSGLAGGAVAIGPANAPTAIAFCVPILTAAIAGRLSFGDYENLLFGGVATFLTLMLVRSALAAQRDFCEGSRTKHAATALAEALRVSNAEAKDIATELQVLASHDSMTGLANRSAFANGIEARLGRAEKGRGTLIMLDLDHFKLINDTLGHRAGDHVLVEIASRLRAILGEEPLAARLGGDEFAILLGDTRPPEEVARDILEAVASPLMMGGRSASISASIGIASFPEDGETAEDLMLRADLALYAAKAAGRGRCCRFDTSLLHAVKVRRDIELDLPAALAAEAIEVWCQPQIALSDQGLVGVELLIRWKHERHGWISPPDIVAAALSTNRSEALTLHVVSHACRLIRDLREQGHDAVTVAVNVSPMELGLYPLAERVAERLAAFGVPARSLEIEITEEAAIAGDAAAREVNALASLGVRIAIDDFGAGYASLASLRTLRVERIKIDRGFVMDMGVREGDRILVQAILGIGQALGLEVVAEGVERAEDVLLLARYGCHVGQGYHFARPMARPAFDAWIAARSAPMTLTGRGTMDQDSPQIAFRRIS